MEQIPVFAYLPPIWYLLTFVYGMYIIAANLQKTDRPGFSVRRHKSIGRIFFIAVIAGVVFGKLADAFLPVGLLPAISNSFLAIALVILTVLAEIFGVQGERKRLRVKTNMMRAHPWFFVLVTALLFGQFIVGLRALRIIRF